MNSPRLPLLATLAFCAALPILAQNPVLNPTGSYGANMFSVKVAELNNNNAPEIIGLDNTSNAVVVLINSGTGSYSAPQYYPISR